MWSAVLVVHLCVHTCNAVHIRNRFIFSRFIEIVPSTSVIDSYLSLRDRLVRLRRSLIVVLRLKLPLVFNQQL
jgi:hypothetical protein